MSKKILVVDDEDNIRELIRIALTRYDCEVIEAANGQEAYDSAKREMPTLIITDHLMPNFTGYELVQKVRQDSKLKKTPILMCTAKQFDSDFPQLLKLENCDFLAKPFDVVELIGSIEKLIGPLPFHM